MSEPILKVGHHKSVATEFANLCPILFGRAEQGTGEGKALDSIMMEGF